jgi:hypothetical protein
MIRRRKFIAGLGSAAAWPIVAQAQPKRLPTIGFIGITHFAWGRWIATF